MQRRYGPHEETHVVRVLDGPSGGKRWAFGHHVLPVHSRATSKITKAPGMTRANANWKNGVMCISRQKPRLGLQPLADDAGRAAPDRLARFSGKCRSPRRRFPTTLPILPATPWPPLRPRVSKPSVNQPHTGACRSRARCGLPGPRQRRAMLAACLPLPRNRPRTLGNSEQRPRCLSGALGDWRQRVRQSAFAVRLGARDRQTPRAIALSPDRRAISARGCKAVAAARRTYVPGVQAKTLRRP